MSTLFTKNYYRNSVPVNETNPVQQRNDQNILSAMRNASQTFTRQNGLNKSAQSHPNKVAFKSASARPVTTVSSQNPRPAKKVSDFDEIVNMMQKVSNQCIETQPASGRFRNKGKGVKQQSVDAVVDAIIRRHKDLNREMVESIAQIEVRAAFDSKMFIGPKQLTELENKVYTQVLFERQYHQNVGYVGESLNSKRGNVSKFVDGIFQQQQKSQNEVLRFSHTTFDYYPKNKQRQPEKTARPITIKGGFLNQNVLGSSDRRNARHCSQSVQSSYKQQQQEDNHYSMEIAVKSLKPSKRQSTYGNSFTRGSLMLNDPQNLKNAESFLALKKQKVNDTNLPGFTENKVDEETKSRLDRQNRYNMARELMQQQRHTQMKLQREQLDDQAYSRQVKRQVNQSEQRERSHNKEVQSANRQNQSMLKNQIRDNELRRLNDFRQEQSKERNQLHNRCATTDKHEYRKKMLKMAWARGTAGINRQQMDFQDQKQLRDRNEDVQYANQLAKNLGYEKLGAKKATKEPSGTIMDQLFASKVHKAYKMGSKVESSSVYPLQERLNSLKATQQNQFDQKYTVGGTLLDLQTKVIDETRQIKSGLEKQDLADALAHQMRERQMTLYKEREENTQFQNQQEADSAAYRREERLKQKKQREMTESYMKIVKEQMPTQKILRQADQL